MIDELPIALLTSDFGQVWVRYDFVQRVAQNLIRLWATCCTKSHMTFCNMMGLRNRVAYNFERDRIRLWARSDTTLGNMLHLMGPWDKIAYDFGRDRIRLHAGMTSLSQICPKMPEMARHEEDHLCHVPHLRKSSMLR